MILKQGWLLESPEEFLNLRRAESNGRLADWQTDRLIQWFISAYTRHLFVELCPRCYWVPLTYTFSHYLLLIVNVINSERSSWTMISKGLFLSFQAITSSCSLFFLQITNYIKLYYFVSFSLECNFHESRDFTCPVNLHIFPLVSLDYMFVK